MASSVEDGATSGVVPAPGGSDAADRLHPEDPVTVLRRAATDLDRLTTDPDRAFDPAEHAQVYEGVHEALQAVLAEIDHAPERA